VYRDLPAEALAVIAQHTSRIRHHTYVNCWNLSEVESAALWGLYVPPSGGVAIKSSFAKLTGAFVAEPADEEGSMANRVFIGSVSYVDYQKTWIPEGNSFYPFVHKRHSFVFEQELRAVIQEVPLVDDPSVEGGKVMDLSQPSPSGRPVRVDLDTLVEAIHVSPVADDWFAELVRAVCLRYNLDKPVVQSSLAGRPVY